MAKIKCTLPNASTEINGVKFVDVDGVMVSENVDDGVAAKFAKIPGYEVIGKPEGEAKPKPHKGDK